VPVLGLLPPKEKGEEVFVLEAAPKEFVVDEPPPKEKAELDVFD
jgi:hypothetical protein